MTGQGGAPRFAREGFTSEACARAVRRLHPITGGRPITRRVEAKPSL